MLHCNLVSVVAHFLKNGKEDLTCSPLTPQADILPTQPWGPTKGLDFWGQIFSHGPTSLQICNFLIPN
jgi:hypothetical protein